MQSEPIHLALFADIAEVQTNANTKTKLSRLHKENDL